jgi:hypothetical protein
VTEKFIAKHRQGHNIHYATTTIVWAYKVSKNYPRNLNFDIREGECSTSPVFVLTRGKTSQYPLNRPQSRFARFGEKVKSLLGPGIKSKFPPSHSPYCSRLLYRLSFRSCWRSRVGSPKRRHWCSKITTDRRKTRERSTASDWVEAACPFLFTFPPSRVHFHFRLAKLLLSFLLIIFS